LIKDVAQDKPLKRRTARPPIAAGDTLRAEFGDHGRVELPFRR
jgi:hypothetical protein